MPGGSRRRIALLCGALGLVVGALLATVPISRGNEACGAPVVMVGERDVRPALRGLAAQEPGAAPPRRDDLRRFEALVRSAERYEACHPAARGRMVLAGRIVFVAVVVAALVDRSSRLH